VSYHSETLVLLSINLSIRHRIFGLRSEGPHGGPGTAVAGLHGGPMPDRRRSFAPTHESGPPQGRPEVEKSNSSWVLSPDRRASRMRPSIVGPSHSSSATAGAPPATPNGTACRWPKRSCSIWLADPVLVGSEMESAHGGALPGCCSGSRVLGPEGRKRVTPFRLAPHPRAAVRSLPSSETARGARGHDWHCPDFLPRSLAFPGQRTVASQGTRSAPATPISDYLKFL
jgi:hypothetical protein